VKFPERSRNSYFASSAYAASSPPWSARWGRGRVRRHSNAAGRYSRRVNGLMAEILEDHIRLHMINPHQKMESPEELGEDLIGLVRAYLK